jgi:membrane-bound ClpP family serine protease
MSEHDVLGVQRSHGYGTAGPSGSGGPSGPESSSQLAPARPHLANRVVALGGLTSLAAVVGALLVASLLAPSAVPWVVGVLLVAAALGAVGLGAHAGGHAWFTPLPVIVLGALWGLTVSTGHWSSPVSWLLAALAFGGAAFAAAVAVPAIASRGTLNASPLGSTLVGAEGVALGPLAPTGIARIKGETWTVESLSGPLPDGAPVHVARVEGLRLMVWSEQGVVLGPEELGAGDIEATTPPIGAPGLDKEQE